MPTDEARIDLATAVERHATEAEQRVLELRLAGYSFAEMADFLPGTDPAALRQRYQRLVRKLRQQMGGQER